MRLKCSYYDGTDAYYRKCNRVLDVYEKSKSRPMRLKIFKKEKVKDIRTLKREAFLDFAKDQFKKLEKLGLSLPIAVR